jgi:hypothetical protein
MPKGANFCPITAANRVAAARVVLGRTEFTNSERFPGAWSPDGAWFVLPTRLGINAWRTDLAAPIVITLDDDRIQSYAIAIGPVVGS